MTKRVCGNCHWFVGEDLCFRYPKENATGPNSFCGEWADASITPEQEERRQFVRQIFLAMTASEWGANYSEDDMWKIAGKLAAAEPQIQREGQQ